MYIVHGMYVYIAQISLMYELIPYTGGGIFGESLATAEVISKENPAKSAGSLSDILLHLAIYIGKENLENCIPFAKFSKKFSPPN